MWRNLSISVVVVCFIGVSIANADLFLTINGENPTNVPLMMSGTGPFQIVLDGNTVIGPNDINIVPAGGTLTAIPDVNNQWTFQYSNESMDGLIQIITNIDMTIDGMFIPANSVIYQLMIFSAPDFVTTARCGMGLDYFFGTEEEEIVEGDSLMFSSEGEGEIFLDIVEVNSDITSNTIWTAGNSYHIAVDINVQALLVIEPGTVVKFASDTKMSVNNGGALISCGTPDNPIKYIPDTDFSGYYCPLYIEETASPATKITYCYIEHAFVGILLFNQRLDCPIENNYLYENTYGIAECGTKLTDIKNNLVYDSGLASISVDLESDEGQADADSRIKIYNNTCAHEQLVGILVVGTDNINNAGEVDIHNNILSESQNFGIDLENHMYYYLYCNGYYNNTADTNDLTEYYPRYETTIPFVQGTGTLPFCYLRQDCNFIDKGWEYVEQTTLIGKTTDIYNFPDTNIVDLGFHYPNWNYSNVGDGNALSEDLNHDSVVNLRDFTLLANDWENPYDIEDLNDMSDKWLKRSDPNIQIQISGDSNNGCVDIKANSYSADTQRIFLLNDGKYIREIFGFRDGDALTMDISESGAQNHHLKVVSVDSNDHVTCSNIKDVSLPHPLNYCVLPETYEANKPVHFAAYNPGAGNITFRVYANGGNPVWSQNFSGNTILGYIPAGITNSNDIDYVSFDTTGGISIPKIIDPVEPPHITNILGLIVVPDWEIRLKNYKTIWQIKSAFEAKEIDYAVLSGKRATYDNVAWYAQNKNILYLYVNAHGNYRLRNSDGSWVLRTSTDLYDGRVVSIKRSDYINPNDAPPWCDGLGYYWETTTRSFATMGFTSLEFAYFDSCYSGALKINANNQLVKGLPGQDGVFDGPYSDMTFALSIDDTSKSRIYQGWFDEAWINIFWNTEYQVWTQSEWYRLGQSDNLFEALDYVIMNWEPTSDPNDPVNAYRLKGQGYLDDIYLRSW